MASKYDRYWVAHLPQIRSGINRVISGAAGRVTVPLKDLRAEGDRQSWSGSAEVRGRQVVPRPGTTMAHLASLANVMARDGICDQWPERTIRFSINAVGDTLTISVSTVPDRGGTSPEPDRDTTSDTDRFYSILAGLADTVGGPRLLRDCHGGSGWPSHGVYFFFENGEIRPDGGPQVVRVGTHALTATSRTTLWNRLSQHRGSLAGRHSGGGNHRASVFRRHVGGALIRLQGLPDVLLQSWFDAHNPSGHLAALEAEVEVEVSRRIGTMPLLWLDVPEREDRIVIERDSIGLLSCRTGGTGIPSPDWLGRHALASKVRESGLWNVDHIDAVYDPSFLTRFAELAAMTR